MVMDTRVLCFLTLVLAFAQLNVEAQPMRGEWEDMRGGGREVRGEPSKDLNEFRHKAHAFKDEFMSLSNDALKLQCQQLEKARERGQQKWMEQQGFFEGLKKMCDALKEANSQKVAKLAHEEKEHVKELAESVKQDMKTNTAGKSVALGCTALLKAKNNGKMEWFESQGWYRKAMQMCTSLSQTSPEELEHRMKAQKGKWFQNLRTVPMFLMKDACRKLSEVPQDHDARRKVFFTKAEKMCATIDNATPEELRELLRRQRKHAETASGQLIKQTCEKLNQDTRSGEMRSFQDEKWYGAMQKMCTKMGDVQGVKNSSIQKRCFWLQKLKETGRDKEYRSQPWYDRLDSACNFLQRKREEKQSRERDHIIV